MRKILYLLSILFLTQTYAQNLNDDLYERNLREDLRLSLAVVTDDKSVVRSGLLVDFYQDSIKIFSNNKETVIHINNIKRIDLMGINTPHKWTFAGFIGGAYLGHLLLFTEEAQKGSYRSARNDDFWAYMLNITIASAAGALGYLAGDVSGESKKTFIFAGDVEKEKKKFRDFISEKDNQGDIINITFQTGSVNTKFSELVSKTQYNYYYNYYSGYNTSSYNMLRKLQINYSINSYVSAGIAFNWITEPDISWYMGDYYNSNISGTQTLEGYGYYAAVEFRPLVKLLPEVLIFSLGAMGGVMDLNYKSTFQGYAAPPDSPPVRTTTLSKKSFSGSIYGSLAMRFNNAVSISLTGDYLYVPGKTTAVPEINLESLPFSTSSIGFSVGFFF